MILPKMKRCFLLLPLLLGSLTSAAPDPLPPLTFRDPGSVATLEPNQATVQWKEPGKVAIAFRNSTWPNVHFTAGHAYPSPNWSSAGALAIDLSNPEDTELPLHVRLDDSSLADGLTHCQTSSATLQPKERTTLIVSLDSSSPGMRAGPPIQINDNSRRCEGGGTIACENVVRFQIFLAKPGRARQLELFGVRWLPKDDFRGIVDRFGQFARADWPGKIHSDEELARSRSAETEWLREHPPISDRDEFGGWKKGPQLSGTGFFRTERVDGRWWLVTPTGHLFWSMGADCVRMDERSPLRGREAMFTWLPDDAKKQGFCDFYHTNLRRKYGDSWESEWARLACERLPSWGFNTIGNWSDPSVFRLRRVPYTATIHLSGGLRIGPKPPPDKKDHGHDHRLPDYFDPKFPTMVDQSVAKAVAEWRDDPWCIGYFVDNELGWDSWAQGGLGGESKIARDALASPATLAARIQLVEMLRAKYGSIEAFSKAWSLKISSWDESVVLDNKSLTEAARGDCAAFLTATAERYFSVVSAAMKKHAPHQLYLGCRFAIRPREVIAVAAKYCDVVSFNIYDYSVSPEKWSFTNDLGKPVIIGEFHFGALDRGLFHTGLRRTENQAARAQAFATYVKSVLEMPAFVGCHWFQYADEPLTGRFDGENYNIGLVTVTDSPYPELRDAAREINAQIYSLRGSHSK